MNFIKKLFYKPVTTNYPPQVIPEKPLEIIEALDAYLMLNSSATITGETMVVKSAKIALNLQHIAVARLLDLIKTNMQLENFSYVPRSVAFIAGPDGSWIFYYALRTDNAELDIDKCNLFLDALTRTNNAR